RPAPPTPVGEPSGLSDEAGAQLVHAALALNRLQQDAAGLRRDGRGERIGVVGSSEADVREQRFEGLALAGLARDRERAEGAAVEGAGQRDDAGFAGRLARVLESGLDGLGPRVAEKRPGAAEAVRETLCGGGQ